MIELSSVKKKKNSDLGVHFAMHLEQLYYTYHYFCKQFYKLFDNIVMSRSLIIFLQLEIFPKAYFLENQFRYGKAMFAET